MLRTKKKLKKKSVKKSTCDEATETPKSVIHFSQIPPPVPGEKLLAALQEWKSGTQQVDLSHNDGENELLQKSKKDLKLVFQCVDTDKKGFLNENEVKSALKLLGFVFNMEGKEYIRKQLDSNKGNLNFKAFQELITDWHGVTRDFYTELKNGFSIIDFDKDGKITAQDLQEASRLAGIQFSNKQLTEMLQAADKNGDHAVDMMEFVEIMLKTNLF
ncbi:centrin-3-like isoform X1 [Engystomops pustulosus]|uniref:centrin-3-like isoform X1 n=1 Tax=Engystomops pustulosus TaxID=76066 RepID=UPI003AFB5F9D